MRLGGFAFYYIYFRFIRFRLDQFSGVSFGNVVIIIIIVIVVVVVVVVSFVWTFFLFFFSW